MEAAGEGPLLIAFAYQAQTAWPLVFLRACVLDINLVRRTVGPGSPDCWTDTVPLPGSLSRMTERQVVPETIKLASVSPFLTWQAFRLSLISTWLV